jgi:hypothetical protein
MAIYGERTQVISSLGFAVGVRDIDTLNRTLQDIATDNDITGRTSLHLIKLQGFQPLIMSVR